MAQNQPFSLQSSSLSEFISMEDQVVYQSKILCRDFINLKLKENALIQRDIYDLNDLAYYKPSEQDGDDSDVSKQGSPNDETVLPCKLGPTDVSKEIITIAVVFERSYPHLFEDVGNYLKVTYRTPVQVQSFYNSVATDIFRGSITWARIVALFIFTAALMVDCIKQRQEKFANVIVDSMQAFIHKKLAHWIVCQGGWPGLLDHFEESRHEKWQLWVLPSVGAIIGILLALLS